MRTLNILSEWIIRHQILNHFPPQKLNFKYPDKNNNISVEILFYHNNSKKLWLKNGVDEQRLSFLRF